MIHDPISDMLTRVRNAVKAMHLKVDIPASRMKIGIVDIWKQHGFIKDYKLYRYRDKGVIRIYLRYFGKKSAIQGLERISKPQKRIYVGYEELTPVKGGMGIEVISTSKGLITDKVARENKVGGEVICRIW